MTVQALSPRPVSVKEDDSDDFYMTVTAERILDVASVCHVRGWMGAIVGSPGIGKSRALRHYADHHPLSAFYYECTACDATIGATLDALTGVFGADRWAGPGRHLKFEAIAYAVRKARSPTVLLLDEAQELSPPALQALKGLHDRTGIGVVLAGNHFVTRQFRGRGGRVREEFAQLDRRICVRRDFKGPALDKDVPIMAAHYGITGRKELRFLTDQAARDHGLARPDLLIRVARDLFPGKPITIDALEEATRMLGYGLA